jgi:hypothetical protein
MKNKIHIVIVALFIIGISFVFNALTTHLKRQSIISKYEKTNAVVIEVAKSTDSLRTFPILQFRTIDNQRVRFNAMNEKNLHKLAKGDTVLVYYDLINPQTMYIPAAGKNWDINAIGLVGLCFCLPAVAFLLVRVRNASILKKWRVQGKKVRANVVTIEVLAQQKVLGLAPYRLVCEGVQSSQNGQNYQFVSPFIWTDPTGMITENQVIDVYVDLKDSTKYVIDFVALKNSLGLFYVQR